MAWQRDGEFSLQDVGIAGTDYYVVHPLLKHLALLSLEDSDAD